MDSVTRVLDNDADSEDIFHRAGADFRCFTSPLCPAHLYHKRSEMPAPAMAPSHRDRNRDSPRFPHPPAPSDGY